MREIRDACQQTVTGGVDVFGFSIEQTNGGDVWFKAVFAHGNISVTANLVPRLMHELCAAALGGNARAAMDIQQRLLPLHRQLFVEANPIAIKWAMQQAGHIGGSLRLPMTELEPVHQPVLLAAMQAAGVALNR